MKTAAPKQVHEHCLQIAPPCGPWRFGVEVQALQKFIPQKPGGFLYAPNDAGRHRKKTSAALAVLGYSQSEIAVALKGIDLDALSLEDIIKQALKKMVKG